MSELPDCRAACAIVDDLGVTRTWHASGGSRASERELREMRDRVLAVARDSGFPERRSGAGGMFDRRCSRTLLDIPLLREAGVETLREDFWSWLACCLLPDVVLWRFPSARESRFVGGVRNTFRRLWVRANLLVDPNRDADWRVYDRLSEDAMVQITERPGLAADVPLARAVAAEWFRCAERVGVTVMEDIMRYAAKSVLARNEIQLLSALSPDRLRAAVAEEFERATSIVLAHKGE